MGDKKNAIFHSNMFLYVNPMIAIFMMNNIWFTETENGIDHPILIEDFIHSVIVDLIQIQLLDMESRKTCFKNNGFCHVLTLICH